MSKKCKWTACINGKLYTVTAISRDIAVLAICNLFKPRLRKDYVSKIIQEKADE